VKIAVFKGKRNLMKQDKSVTDLIPQVVIENKIFMLRGKKVMLDRDLARLYGVATGNLNKAVKRNIERFPDDFMLRLTKDEEISLRFHFGSLKRGQHTKYLPYAFTEQGVAMLSSGFLLGLRKLFLLIRSLLIN
jgi:hypothetical protein